jgi:hypothetical protein
VKRPPPPPPDTDHIRGGGAIGLDEMAAIGCIVAAVLLFGLLPAKSQRQCVLWSEQPAAAARGGPPSLALRAAP